MVKLNQLLAKYDDLRKYIYLVIQENRNKDDEYVDNLDILQQKEEEFAINLEDYLSD